MLDDSSALVTKRLGNITSQGPAIDKVRRCASKLFDSAQERAVAVSIHKNGVGRDEHMFPGMFRYGLCYSPDPSEGDVYRTISISGLASTVTVNMLLEKVRGGVVVSVKLLDTTTITGSHTALIFFLHEQAAVLFEDFAIKHPLVFDGRRAKVELLSKPTWPMPIPLQKAIYEHGHTRCLTLHNFPRTVSPEVLRRDLRVCSVMVRDHVESMNMRPDSVLELRFESIWTAGRAYGVLTCYRKYRQCRVAFSPDPCAQPLPILDKHTGQAVSDMTLNNSEAENPQTLSAEGPSGIDSEEEVFPESLPDAGSAPSIIGQPLDGIGTEEHPVAGAYAL